MRYDMRASSHTARVRWLRIVEKHFETTGQKIPDNVEDYIKMEDKPMLISQIRSIFRSYPRLYNMLNARRVSVVDGSTKELEEKKKEAPQNQSIQAAIAAAAATASVTTGTDDE